MKEALEYVKLIAANSPDAISAACLSVRESWVQANVEDAVQDTLDGPWSTLQKSENLVQGVKGVSGETSAKLESRASYNRYYDIVLL